MDTSLGKRTFIRSFSLLLLQQSIFLVVIIESFADLRSGKAIGSAPKTKDKPLIVRTRSRGLSLDQLMFHSYIISIYSKCTVAVKNTTRMKSRLPSLACPILSDCSYIGIYIYNLLCERLSTISFLCELNSVSTDGGDMTQYTST